jgi:hypothetical protein
MSSGEQQYNKAKEQVDNSKGKFGIQEDFNRARKLMSRSS